MAGYKEEVMNIIPRAMLVKTYREVYNDAMATEELDDGWITEDEWLASCAEMDEGDPEDSRCFPQVVAQLKERATTV